jgi:hypothetical protein
MSNYAFRAKATPLAICATIALFAASCVVGEPQRRQYVIEPPNGRDCQTLGGSLGTRSSTYLHDARFIVPSGGHLDNSSQHNKACRAQV